MGWISDRHMKQGGSIGPGGLGKNKKGAPLRKIVRIIRPSESIFETAWVEFECGHEGSAWGGVRGRCVQCKTYCRCTLTGGPHEIVPGPLHAVGCPLYTSASPSGEGKPSTGGGNS